jgi:hypothetical protein
MPEPTHQTTMATDGNTGMANVETANSGTRANASNPRANMGAQPPPPPNPLTTLITF